MEMGDGSLAEPNVPEQLKCILHLGEDTSEPVKKFSQKMLDNCRQKALVYKFRKTCNYESIVIPEVISDTVGYHTSCYRSFTAVKGTEVPKMGTQAMNNFIRCCTEDPTAFEKPIKRQKVFTFAEEGAKETKRINGKLKEIQMQRDMCGKLLMLSMKNKIDMKLVFKFPLSIVPLVFGQTDGTMNHTPKATLINAIAGKSATHPPRHIDAYVIDGFFFLHLFASVLPGIYQDIVRFLLVKLINFPAKEIHLVFDNIKSPSIKDTERDRRGNLERHTLYSTLGLQQKRPSNFANALRSDSFKIEFVKLLSTALCDSSLSSVLGDKIVYVTEGEKCFSFKNTDEVGILRKEDIELGCCQEEADTRMIAHATNIPSPATVVIRSVDTDVFIIALSNISKMNPQKKLYLETGLAAKNSLKFFNISSISEMLGQDLARSLSGFHSFTGCDQIPAFAGKGKLKPLRVLKSNPAYQKAFASLGSSEMISNDIITELDKFTCEIYGIKRNTNADKQPTVNDARYQMFCEKYDSKKKKLSLLKVKGIDGSSLPPSKSALEQQIKRANCLCSVWNHSYSFESQMFSPVGNGWVLHSDENGERFSLHWFDGDMAPTNLDDILEMQHPEETSNEEDSESEQEVDNDSEEEEAINEMAEED